MSGGAVFRRASRPESSVASGCATGWNATGCCRAFEKRARLGEAVDRPMACASRLIVRDRLRLDDDRLSLRGTG